MAINFPNSPIAGEYFVTGGLTYQYTGTVWVSVNTKTNNAYNQANTAFSSAVLKTGNTMTGNLVMSGANISLIGNSLLDVSGSFSVAKANALNQTLTYGANAFTNWDASLGQVATVTLTGSNTTLNVATNLRVGTYILHVIQDATGNRLITFGSGYKFTGAFSPPLTSNANARDIFSFISDGTNMYGVMVPDVR